MSEPVDDALLRLAQSVADGRLVNWEEASLTDEASDAQLSRLKILASIARVCGMPADLPSLPGDSLFRWGHLEIREKIGEGAYGDVFRGWDTTLEREVAVKFLRADSAYAAAHVLQEARHLARVRHPGVVTVYGGEELDGRVGIWMEHVRGRTLEDLLQERGLFSPAETIQIGIDLCRALAAVHGAGLVHRDVKASNVVRDDAGRIVLMDFGAGADVRAEGDAPGLSGTPIYLAPEVLRGDAASARSDLYGLGVLLYRLVTASYPTVAGSVEALRLAHERGDVRPLSAARSDLPAPFVRAVERALSYDPACRFATALEMEAALVAARDAPGKRARRRVLVAAVAALALVAASATYTTLKLRGAPGAPGRDHPLIAIADVASSVPDPELDALAGLLATSLEQSQTLSVLTRSRMIDVLVHAERPGANRIDRVAGLKVARRVDATALLLPSVRASGSRYRIALDAVDPQSGKPLFAVAAEADGKEQIPPAIDALARRVRDELERDPAATRALARPVAQITTASLTAYRHYYLAERLIDQLAMAEARGELEQAIALDSTFGLAHCRLAYACWWLNDPPGEREHLAKAFALIDRVPERQRYHLRAQGAMANREGLEASRSILLEMERFYPDDKEMLFDIGDYSSHLNEFPTAIQYLDQVIAMDPDFVRALQHVARVYRDMGRRDRFLEWAKRYAAADTTWDTYILLGNAQVVAGDSLAGIATLARGRELAPAHAQDFSIFIADALSCEGRFAEGEREWDRLLEATREPVRRAGTLRERAHVRVHEGRYRDALADLKQAAELARQTHRPVEEAIARMDAAHLHMAQWQDARVAFEQIARCAALDTAITYRGTYFQYWPYWGGLFKLRLMAGQFEAAAALAREKFSADKWYGPYVDAYLHAARGECAQAAAAASRVLEWGPADENIPLLFFLARCQSEHGESQPAIASLVRLQSIYSHLTIGTPYYARSLLLLGALEERSGDPQRAAECYARLLDLWRTGDPDLPDRLEARRRLASLEPMLHRQALGARGALNRPRSRTAL